MITVTQYAQQKVGVFGLGKAGDATIKALLAGDAQVFAWDDVYKPSPLEGEGRVGGSLHDKKTPPPTPLPQGEGGLKTIPITDWPWQELRALVLSPGVPLTHPAPHDVVKWAKKHNVPVIGDIELLYRACPKARYIGITGTNGKSTTTTLIGHILKTAGLKVEVGGNLGTAALSLNPLGEDEIYVLELSSYQLDLVKTTRFNVAVLLNITPDHLDRHGDMKGYIAAKMHIFDRQQAEDTALIAVDDDDTRDISLELKQKAARLVEVSAYSSSGVYVSNGILYDKELRFDLNVIPTLPGRHNHQNAAAAYAAARACRVSPDVIYHAMQSFAGLRHRLQLVATIRGVRFINDSKATNADATSNALAPYENIYWIAGGKAKEGGIASLSLYFPKIVHAFLIGAAEQEFAETLQGKVPCTRCGTLENAVKKAAEMAFAENRKGAVVLLSPACASFDQWKNFEERGDAFCAMVESLIPSGENHHAV